MDRNIHVIGPFNTGTNLVFHLINNSKCVDLNNNQTIKIKDINYPFHKHIIDMNCIEKYLQNPNNLLIIMYKNIYSWLYSIKKAPYNIRYTKLYLPVELYGKRFSNMIELYNYYYVNYTSILQKYSNVIFLDYKKVVDQSISFNYINNKLNKLNIYLTSNENFINTLMRTSKDHGNPVKNANEAIDKYTPNKELVENFVKRNIILKNSIRPRLFQFYENIYG